MRYVLHRDSSRLTEKDRWYLARYLNMSNELREAYEFSEGERRITRSTQWGLP